MLINIMVYDGCVGEIYHHQFSGGWQGEVENASQYRVSYEVFMVTLPACGTRVPVFLLANMVISTLGPLACVRIVLTPSRLWLG